MKKLILTIIFCAVLLTGCSEYKDISLAETAKPLPIGETDFTSEEIPVNDGESGICQVHSACYHNIPNVLVDYVGTDKYNAWYDEAVDVEVSGDCRHPEMNIYKFAQFFKLTPKELNKIYDSGKGDIYYNSDYDISLLFYGSEVQNDTYYRDNYDDAELKLRTAFGQIKKKIIIKYFDAESPYLSDTTLMFSLPELIYAADIPQSEFEQMLSSAETYDLDIDLIYHHREWLETVMSKHSAYFTDCIVCGLRPYETPSSVFFPNNEISVPCSDRSVPALINDAKYVYEKYNYISCGMIKYGVYAGKYAVASEFKTKQKLIDYLHTLVTERNDLGFLFEAPDGELPLYKETLGVLYVQPGAAKDTTGWDTNGITPLVVTDTDIQVIVKTDEYDVEAKYSTYVRLLKSDSYGWRIDCVKQLPTKISVLLDSEILPPM